MCVYVNVYCTYLYVQFVFCKKRPEIRRRQFINRKPALERDESHFLFLLFTVILVFFTEENLFRKNKI